MRDYDDQIAWIADLDWSVHGEMSNGFISQRVFLATAARAMGRTIAAPWSEDDLLRHASNDHPAGAILAEDAFSADGVPISSIHAALAPVMRRHAELRLLPIAAADSISFEEWDAIIDDAADDWHMGLSARRAAAGLAPLFARLAYDGVVRCHARPEGGGDGRSKPIPRELWDIDPSLAIRRLAACGLDPERPFDADAPPTHRIFVEDGGLQNAFIEAARQHHVATEMLEFGPLKRAVDYLAVNRGAVAEFLASLMTDENLGWSSDRFKRAVQDEFGGGALGRTYEKARAMATDHPDRRRFRKRRPNAEA